jgi:hypothetical protein
MRFSDCTLPQPILSSRVFIKKTLPSTALNMLIKIGGTH